MIKEYLNGFIKEEDGVTTLEYVFLIVLIALVIFLAVKTLGSTMKTKFGKMTGALNS